MLDQEKAHWVGNFGKYCHFVSFTRTEVNSGSEYDRIDLFHSAHYPLELIETISKVLLIFEWYIHIEVRII